MDRTCIDYLKCYNSMDRIHKIKKYQFLLIVILLSFLILITIGTIIFMWMFNLSFIDGLYTSTLILTSIDIEVTPVTSNQKIFIIIYSIIAVIIFLGMANAGVQYFFNLMTD